MDIIPLSNQIKDLKDHNKKSLANLVIFKFDKAQNKADKIVDKNRKFF